VKRNFWGQKIEPGPWKNQTLINLKGIRITYQDAAIGAGAIAGIVIAIVVVIVLCIIWKRKKVQEISVDIK